VRLDRGIARRTPVALLPTHEREGNALASLLVCMTRLLACLLPLFATPNTTSALTPTQQTIAARTELLGRRPHHTSTPENPYSQQNISSQNSPFAPAQPRSDTASYRPNAYSSISNPNAPNDFNDDRTSHAFREQNFFAQTSTQLDEFLDRGRTVLGDLGDQRDMLKGTQRRLYSVANTLGVSGETIRMVERRARQDKWVFGVGVVVFFGFCWAVLHFLR
jgi:hypothetical protein